MAGLLSPESGAALARLGAGLLSGNFAGGLASASEYAAGLPEQKLRAGLLQAQLSETQAQAQERAIRAQREQAEMERMARIRQSLPSLYRQSGMTGGAAAPQTMGGVEMFSQPAGVTPMQATPGGFDVQRAIELGMDPKMIQEYAGLQNIGRQEVARTVNVPGPNGEKMVMQLDKYGQPVGKPMTEFEAAQFLNLGDRHVAAVPRAGMQFQAGMSPEARASNALGWANHSLSKQRLALDASQPKGQVVETPNGFVLVDPRQGTSQAITGPDGQPLRGKGTDRNLTDAQAKANLFGSRMLESDRILRDLEGKYSPAAVNAKMSAAEVPLVGGVAGFAGNLMLSREGQMAEQAQRDFVNAVLRRESGAVISPQEFVNAQKQYFPQPGDSADVLDQKRRNRQIAIEGLMAEVPEGRRGVPSLSPQKGGASGSWGGQGGWSIQKVN